MRARVCVRVRLMHANLVICNTVFGGEGGGDDLSVFRLKVLAFASSP